MLIACFPKFSSIFTTLLTEGPSTKPSMMNANPKLSETANPKLSETDFSMPQII